MGGRRIVAGLRWGAWTMAESQQRARAFAIPQIAPEVRNFAVLAATAAAVIGVGAGISAILPASVSPWLSVSAYAAPAGLAFLAYWWNDQKL